MQNTISLRQPVHRASVDSVAPPPAAPSGRPASRSVSEAAGIWIGCIVILATLWIAIVGVTLERTAANRSERAALSRSTAKGFSEYVGLHLLITDRMLVNSRNGFATSGAIPRHELLTAEFGQMAPMLMQVAISDAQGRLVASSLPLAPNLSIADRPHFLAFRDDPRDRLYVSQPVVGRVSGKMSLQLVRPLLGPGGEFRGVIVASIDPIRLQQYFGSVDAFQDEGAVMILGRTDGVVRARFSAKDITWGQSLLKSVAWDRLSATTSGSYEGKSVLDGSWRTVGFHRVADYPLTVTVSTAGGEWPVKEVMLSVVIGLAFSLFKLKYTGARVRHSRQQEEVIAQLDQSRKREMEANRMKSNFIASVSHELRTPLNSILGFSELIRDDPADPSNARYAGLIHGSGKHLHALLNDLLDLAKIEAGRMQVDVGDVDLTQTVHTLVEVHRASAARKGIAITERLQVAPGRTVRADTDATKFVQVLNNVLSNAVKFTQEGSVSVTASCAGNLFILSVKDTGCGISAAQMPRVFERFSTLESGGTLQQEGTGLGLSLSRDLMLLLGGTIAVHSQPGAGTEVTITLPGARLAESQT